jgi:hypothetical protein
VLHHGVGADLEPASDDDREAREGIGDVHGSSSGPDPVSPA